MADLSASLVFLSRTGECCETVSSGRIVVVLMAVGNPKLGTTPVSLPVLGPCQTVSAVGHTSWAHRIKA